MELDFKAKFTDSYTKMQKIGEDYAEAKGQSWQMQELKSSILSSIIKASGDIPTSKAEILARSSEDYKQYIKETADSIKKELRLKAQYEAEKARFEALRSLSSLEKIIIKQSEGV